jgi:hypothetical protein
MPNLLQGAGMSQTLVHPAPVESLPTQLNQLSHQFETALHRTQISALDNLKLHARAELPLEGATVRPELQGLNQEPGQGSSPEALL